MKRRKKKSRLIIPLLVLGAAAFWGVRHYGVDTSAAPPPYQTVTVDRGVVSQRVVAHGTIEPVEKVQVGSQVSGIIKEIHVDFNSLVSRGQVIAQIDPSTFAVAVSAAEAELAAAEAELALAHTHWERMRQLGDEYLVSVAEVEHARANLQQSEARVNVRRHALERAQRELDYCTIYAPTNGIVISRDVDVGQTVAASLNAPLLFLIASDLDRMHIHASVSEADIGRVRSGQSVRFRVDGHRDREFEGRVIQVRNAPLVQDNVVHYETIIAVHNRERILKPGMTAEVAIVTAEVDDAPRVRNTALRARLPEELTPPEPEPDETANGRVYVLRDGELRAVAVRTGLSDNLYTEILHGLEVGDTLVVGLSLEDARGGRGRTLLGGSQAQF
jgi:HlyD family secretion protein